MIKSELRKIYLDKRRTVSPDQMAAKSRQIAERFFAEVDLRTVNILSTFISIEKLAEIDVSLIYTRIWADFPLVKTVSPITDFATGELENRQFAAATPLVENRWGIREPLGGEIVEASDIDLVLVPLLSVDEEGYRVGYGKGFYDKFLGRCRVDCLKVGVSLFPPVQKIEDADDYDVPIDICITPENRYVFEPALNC